MTTATTALPTFKAVRDTFADLLFRNVDVLPSEPVAVGPRNPIAVGVYVDDAMRLAAVAVADLPLAAYVGASIGLVPKGGAQAAIEDGVLPQSIAENFSEVLNVLSALLNVEGRQLRLHATYAPGQLAPGDVMAVVRTLGRRVDLAVTVAGYGTGHLGLVLNA